MRESAPFETDDAEKERPSEDALIIDVDGFEGPLDLLLTLARAQKVDLTKISIGRLADQYLEFVQRALRSNLDLAAEYLVTAAWLAYLKSRLLLPPDEEDHGEDAPLSAAEMGELLTFRLRQLEAMQQAGRKLMARPLLGEAVFARGVSEESEQALRPIVDVGLMDLLKAYAGLTVRTSVRTLHIEPARLWCLDDALKRLEGLLGRMPNWSTLSAYLPTVEGDPLMARSATAAIFVAMLELCRQGQLRIRQDDGPFGPLRIGTGDAH